MAPKLSDGSPICSTGGTVAFSRERLTQISGQVSRDRNGEALLSGFLAHLNRAKLECAVYAGHHLYAIEHPEEILSVIIDSTDQSKLSFPKFKWKRQQNLTGAFFHSVLGKEEFLAYFKLLDNLPADASQTIRAFVQCVLTLLEHRAIIWNSENEQLDTTSI